MLRASTTYRSLAHGASLLVLGMLVALASSSGLGLVVRSSPLRQPSRGGLTATATATADQPLTSLLDLADQYDAFLLDQFGVIHDGKTAYDGAVEAVSERHVDATWMRGG